MLSTIESLFSILGMKAMKDVKMMLKVNPKYRVLSITEKQWLNSVEL